MSPPGADDEEGCGGGGVLVAATAIGFDDGFAAIVGLDGDVRRGCEP